MAISSATEKISYKTGIASYLLGDGVATSVASFLRTAEYHLCRSDRSGDVDEEFQPDHYDVGSSFGATPFRFVVKSGHFYPLFQPSQWRHYDVGIRFDCCSRDEHLNSRQSDVTGISKPFVLFLW